MEFRHLSDKFYREYPSEQFPELMIKENRPYTQVITEINGLKFAVPLRSDISHTTDVLWTDKQARHGLDFTKAVIILDDDSFLLCNILRNTYITKNLNQLNNLESFTEIL